MYETKLAAMKLAATLLLFSGALLACAPAGTNIPNATTLPAATAGAPTEQATSLPTLVPSTAEPATIEATSVPSIVPSTTVTVTTEATTPASTVPASAAQVDCG